MAEPPISHEAADRALTHLVTHLYDVELARLAYARPVTEGDRRRTAAATREMARRAALAGDDAALGAQPDRGGPRPRAVLTAIMASALLLGVIALDGGGTAPTAATPPSSLQLLHREATLEERLLRARLLDEGLRLTVGPRVIAEAGTTRVVAYRYVSIGTAATTRNEVCVLLLDDGPTQPPRCTDRASFLLDGLEATLVGEAARYALRWSPTAPPSVSAAGTRR